MATPSKWIASASVGLYDFFRQYGINQNDPWRVVYPDGRRDTVRDLEDLDSEYPPAMIETFSERPLRFRISGYFEEVEAI